MREKGEKVQTFWIGFVFFERLFERLLVLGFFSFGLGLCSVGKV